MVLGWLKGIGRGARTAEHGAEDLGALARIFRGAEKTEKDLEEVGEVGKKIEKATGALKKGVAGITAAGAATLSVFKLLAIVRIADDINEIFNSPHAAEIVSAILGIVALVVGYLVLNKFSSGAKKVGELAKNKIKSGGGVKKLSDTLCFFILISFIFIINFLYEKYLEFEKEKEKIIQSNYQSIQNY